MAESFCQFIETDAELQGRALQRVAMQMAAMGHFEDAGRVARAVAWTEFRGPETCARVAAAAARDGRRDVADWLAAMAAGRVEWFGEWRRDRVRAAIIEALAEMGRFDEAWAQFGKLEGAGERGVAAMSLARAYMRLDREAEGREAFEKIPDKMGIDIAAIRARASVEVARWLRERGREKDAEAVLVEGLSNAAELEAWHDAGSLAALGREWLGAGREAQGNAALVSARSAALALADVAEWKVGDLVRVAEAMIAVGQTNAAQELIAAARPLPDKVEPLFRGESLAALARGCLLIGDEAGAIAAWEATAELALHGLTHHRPRARTAVDLCLSYAQAGEAFHPVVRERLRALRVALEKERRQRPATTGATRGKPVP